MLRVQTLKRIVFILGLPMSKVLNINSNKYGFKVSSSLEEKGY